MGSAVGQARGLPFVPPAAPSELFGAWMLRVAEAYGITVKRSKDATPLGLESPLRKGPKMGLSCNFTSLAIEVKLQLMGKLN
jgi:hypothetical protein